MLIAGAAAPADPAGPDVRWPRLMLVAACGSVAMIIGLALGTVAILPAIGRDLAADQTKLQWIADVFPLVVAALLLPAGAALDRYGRRRGMLLGLALLTAAMGWGALCTSADQLIAARAASGVGAALVFPGTLATISDSIGADKRMFAVALWGTGGILGGVAAIDFGALLVEIAGWQEAFWFFALGCGGLFALTAVAVPETRSPEPAGIDIVGAILSVLGIGLIVLALTEAPVHGWDAWSTIAAFSAGVLCSCAFVLWELRAPLPLLDVRLFLDRRFGASSVALFGMFLADFAMIFLVFQYEVYVLGYGTLKAALGIIPPGILMTGAVLAAGPLVRRLGRRVVISGALCVCAAGTFVCAVFAGDGGSYLAMATGNSLIWCGIGLGLVSPTVDLLESLPPAKQGVASAVNDLTRELGAVFGIAIGGSAFNAAYRSSVADDLDASDMSTAREVLEAPGAGLAAGGDRVAQTVIDGVLAGWRASFIVTGVVLLATAAFVAARYPSDR